MTKLTRRELLQLSAAGVLLGSGLMVREAHAEGSTVTIAYNVNLPSWDPTTGLSAVNPTIQSIYRSVFDQFIGQSDQRGGAGVHQAAQRLFEARHPLALGSDAFLGGLVGG